MQIAMVKSMMGKSGGRIGFGEKGSMALSLLLTRIMTPNTQPPLRVFAVEVYDKHGRLSNKRFLEDLEVACAEAGVPLQKIDGNKYGSDPWIQDQIEFGY